MTGKITVAYTRWSLTSAGHHAGSTVLSSVSSPCSLPSQISLARVDTRSGAATINWTKSPSILDTKSPDWLKNDWSEPALLPLNENFCCADFSYFTTPSRTAWLSHDSVRGQSRPQGFSVDKWEWRLSLIFYGKSSGMSLVWGQQMQAAIYRRTFHPHSPLFAV